MSPPDRTAQLIQLYARRSTIANNQLPGEDQDSSPPTIDRQTEADAMNGVVKKLQF